MGKCLFYGPFGVTRENPIRSYTIDCIKESKIKQKLGKYVWKDQEEVDIPE
jgi:hypothetical protein